MKADLVDLDVSILKTDPKYLGNHEYVVLRKEHL